MTTAKFATVCANKHIRDLGDEQSELNTIQRHCSECGEKVHQACPNCENPIPVRKESTDEGATYWNVPRFCFNCGEAYPWGPSRIGQWLEGVADAMNQSNPRPNRTILSNQTREILEATKYGDELIKHVQDGDSCYRNQLWFPALTMYIHAFEWAAITFLEAKGDLDIIEKERQGTNYYLAGGHHNLLDELDEHVEIDQKTLSQIASVNRLERRWAAHHKSGETLRQEVDAVRARLGKFIELLFGD